VVRGDEVEKLRGGQALTVALSAHEVALGCTPIDAC